MSYPIMPALPISMAKGLKKTPSFNTVLQKVAAGRGNAAISLKPYPTWDFEFDMEHILGNEAVAGSVVAQFLGIFLQTQGSAGLFLFTELQDNTVTQSTGIMLNVTPGAATPMDMDGDGVSTQFQLARLIDGSGVDITQNLNGSIVVKVNGSTVVPASISSTGVVTFTSAPANNATITWAGSFYFLCRFEEDTLDATRNFTNNSGIDQWDFVSIKFSSELV
jgi:uncharacterized protein (TIGR02217 family)